MVEKKKELIKIRQKNQDGNSEWSSYINILCYSKRKVEKMRDKRKYERDKIKKIKRHCRRGNERERNKEVKNQRKPRK